MHLENISDNPSLIPPSMSSRAASQRVQDILNAIQSIQQRIATLNYEEFFHNETINKAVLYDLIVIGEAANQIPRSVQVLAPEIPWRLMSDMRNIITHEYFQVSLKITWQTINNNIPGLIRPLQHLLTQLSEF